MKKNKLITKRKEQGLTQEVIADYLFMDTSQYNRRENGTVKILEDEWEKLSTILNCSIEDIYESDELNFYVKNKGNGNVFGHNNNLMPEFALESLKKYIQSIEDENKYLKSELAKFNLSNT